MTARARFESLLRGEMAAPAFVPLLEPLAPRLAGCSYSAMTADASAWSAGVLQSAKLLGADALCVGFDIDLAVEACRASMENPEAQGGFAVLVDTAGRLFDTQRGKFGCVAALCGPATLAARLAPGQLEKEALSAVKTTMNRLLEALCRHRPDLVVFMEAPEAVPATPSADLRRAYATLRKVAAYYGIASGLHASAGAALQALGCDVLFLEAGEAPPTDGWRAAVVPLPTNSEAARTACTGLLAAHRPGGPAIGFGLSGLMGAVDLEAVRGVRAAIETIAA